MSDEKPVKRFIGGSPSCRYCGSGLDFDNSADFETIELHCSECGRTQKIKQIQETTENGLDVWFDYVK